MANLDINEPATNSRHQDSITLATVAKDFGKAYVQSALVSPAWNGVGQLASLGTLPQLSIVSEENARNSTADFWAQKVGGALGVATDFALLSKLRLPCANRAVASESPALESLSFSQQALAKSLEGAKSGAIYGALFMPSDRNENLIWGRFVNASSQAAMFAGLSGGTALLSSAKGLFNFHSGSIADALSDMSIAGAVGVPVGATGALLDSTLRGKTLALDDIKQAGIDYGIMGLGLAAMTHGAAAVSSHESIASAPLKSLTTQSRDARIEAIAAPEDHRIAPEKDVVERLRQEKADVLQGSEQLALHLASRFPQSGEAGEVRWVFGGSLAANLLAKSDHLVEFDSAQLPRLVPIKTVEIPLAVQKDYLNFARRVGDVDVVPLAPMETWAPKESWAVEHDYYPLDELPKNALSALGKSTNGKGKEGTFLFDAIPLPGHPRVVALEADGLQLLVSDPCNLAAAKFVHALHQFGRGGNESKFIDDFAHLSGAASKLHGQYELNKQLELEYETARARASEHSPTFEPEHLYLHSYSPAFNRSFGGLAEKLLEKDSNFPSLSQVKVDQTRSFEILGVLGRLTNEQDKIRMIKHINAHADLVEQWETVDSPSTRRTLAQYIFDQRPDIKSAYDGIDPAWGFKADTVENLADTLQGNTFLREQLAGDMNLPLPRRPVRSDFMSTLMFIDPTRVEAEIAAHNKLERIATPQDVYRKFRSAPAQDPAMRKLLTDGINSVDLSSLTKQQQNELAAELKSVMTDAVYNFEPGVWRELTLQDRKTLLSNILRRYGEA